MHRMLPPSFEQFDMHTNGSHFYLHPEKGRYYEYDHAIGSSGIDENTYVDRNYDPNIDYRPLFESTTRIKGIVSASPESSPTFTVHVGGIYDEPPYDIGQEVQPIGHTEVRCLATLPIEYFASIQRDQGKALINTLGQLVFTGAMALGYNNFSSSGYRVHQASLEEFINPLMLRLEAASQLHPSNTLETTLSHLITSQLRKKFGRIAIQPS